MLRIELRSDTPLGEPIPASALVHDSGLAPSSITGLLRAAAQQGLVAWTARHGAALTDAGRAKAMLQLRRHRLVETYLNRALGLDWSEVHDEAVRIDAAVSERVIDRMDEVLGHPTSDPHGDPIPDRDGRLPGPRRACCVTAALQTAEMDPAAGPVTRFSVGQTVVITHVVGHDPSYLRLLGGHGILPEAVVRIVGNDAIGGTITLAAVGYETFTLGQAAATPIHAKRALG